MDIIAPCGSPLGSNTSANSAIGAVPSGCNIDAITMKKCIKQQIVIISYPPNSLFVMLVVGSSISNNQGSCGKNVAMLNAVLILFVVNSSPPTDNNGDDDSDDNSVNSNDENGVVESTKLIGRCCTFNDATSFNQYE